MEKTAPHVVLQINGDVFFFFDAQPMSPTKHRSYLGNLL